MSADGGRPSIRPCQIRTPTENLFGIANLLQQKTPSSPDSTIILRLRDYPTIRNRQELPDTKSPPIEMNRVLAIMRKTLQNSHNIITFRYLSYEDNDEPCFGSCCSSFPEGFEKCDPSWTKNVLITIGTTYDPDGTEPKVIIIDLRNEVCNFSGRPLSPPFKYDDIPIHVIQILNDATLAKIVDDNEDREFIQKMSRYTEIWNIYTIAEIWEKYVNLFGHTPNLGIPLSILNDVCIKFFGFTSDPPKRKEGDSWDPKTSNLLLFWRNCALLPITVIHQWATMGEDEKSIGDWGNLIKNFLPSASKTSTARILPSTSTTPSSAQLVELWKQKYVKK